MHVCMYVYACMRAHDVCMFVYMNACLYVCVCMYARIVPSLHRPNHIGCKSHRSTHERSRAAVVMLCRSCR